MIEHIPRAKTLLGRQPKRKESAGMVYFVEGSGNSVTLVMKRKENVSSQGRTLQCPQRGMKVNSCAPAEHRRGDKSRAAGWKPGLSGSGLFS